jgi:hypothetical protein
MISLVFTNVFSFHFLDIEILAKLNPKKKEQNIQISTNLFGEKWQNFTTKKKRIGPHYFLMKLSSFMICSS